MHVIADLSVTPVGVGNSLAPYIAACEEIIEQAGLKHQLHAHGTNLEGAWEDVASVVQRCHEALHEKGAVQVSTSLKVDTYDDETHSMEKRVSSVEAQHS